MEIANCPRCGKIFTKMSNPLCDQCVKEEEAAFKKVHDFLDANPGSTLQEVSAATGASVKKLMKYIQDGRLESTFIQGCTLTCDKCGKPIKTGRYCDKCIIEINQAAKDLFEKKTGYNGPKMHTSGHGG